MKSVTQRAHMISKKVPATKERGSNGWVFDLLKLSQDFKGFQLSDCSGLETAKPLNHAPFLWLIRQACSTEAALMGAGPFELQLRQKQKQKRDFLLHVTGPGAVPRPKYEWVPDSLSSLILWKPVLCNFTFMWQPVLLSFKQSGALLLLQDFVNSYPRTC